MKLIILAILLIGAIEFFLAAIRNAQRARKLYAQPPMFKYAPRRAPHFTTAQIETMLGRQNTPKSTTRFDAKFDDEVTREY